MGCQTLTFSSFSQFYMIGNTVDFTKHSSQELWKRNITPFLSSIVDATCLKWARANISPPQIAPFNDKVAMWNQTVCSEKSQCSIKRWLLTSCSCCRRWQWSCDGRALVHRSRLIVWRWSFLFVVGQAWTRSQAPLSTFTRTKRCPCSAVLLWFFTIFTRKQKNMSFFFQE